MLAVGGNGWPPALIGLGVALGCGLGWGVFNGAVIAYAHLNPLIVTLATLGIALGLAQVITQGVDIFEFPIALRDFGAARVVGIPYLVCVALAVVVVAGFVLAQTRFGRITYAVGSSREATRRAGINVERHLLRVYALSGLLAGLAGWLSLARFSTTSLSGHSLDALNAITGALLGGVSLFGGVGSILGTFFGTLIPVVLGNGLVIIGVQTFWQSVAVGIVLLIAVYMDRVRRDREP
jgi:ribose transport system permease protein